MQQQKVAEAKRVIGAELTGRTLLNHPGSRFLARASVDPKPAITPADATVVRKAAPAHRKSGGTEEGWKLEG